MEKNKHTKKGKLHAYFRASPQDMRRLLQNAEKHELSREAKRRLQWFSYALEHDKNISLTCRHFGIARSTFLCWAKRFDPDDPQTLEEQSRRPLNVRAPETTPEVIEFIRNYREESPKISKHDIQLKLQNEHKIEISASTIGRVINRHCFFFADTPSHKQKRINAQIDGTSEEKLTTEKLETAFGEAVEQIGTQSAAETDTALEERGKAGSISELEKRKPPGENAEGTKGPDPGGGTVLPLGLLFFAASLVGGLLASSGTAYASESTSFRLYDEFPNYGERHERSSTSFRLNEDGITWEAKPIASTSFQIVTAPPAAAAAAPPDDDDDEAPPGGGGGGGGRRPCLSAQGLPRPCPTPEPEPKPEVPEEPTPDVPPTEEPPVAEPVPEDVPPLIAQAEPERRVVYEAPRIETEGSKVEFFDQVDYTPSPLTASLLSEQPHDAAWETTLIIRSIYRLQWPFVFLLGVAIGGLCIKFGAWNICLHLSAPIIRLVRSVNGNGGNHLRKYGLFFFLPLFGIHERDKKKRQLSLLDETSKEKKQEADESTRFKREMLGEEEGSRGKWFFRLLWLLLLTLMLGISFLLASKAFAATTAPLRHVYNGHLLDSSGNAITTAHSVRFSYWSSADFVTGDVTGTGAINTGASLYRNWNEVHTVTPNSDGYFTVELGSSTALPDIASLPTDFFLQVEVKTSAAADTAYELLDVNTSSTTVDRSPVLSVPFALNADKLDLRDTGTASGSIPVLGSGGILPASAMSTGSTLSGFTIDVDGSESGDLTLTFGGIIAKTLKYSQSNTRFEFNDDLNVTGDLNVSGLINGIDITNIASGTGVLKTSSGGGLTAEVRQGSYRLSGNITNFVGSGAVGLTANATNFLYFTSTGLLVNTAAFPTNVSYIPLSEVTTNGVSVTNVEDRRALATDDRERSLQINYHAEFEDVSYQGDATSNTGQLYTSHDGDADRNFYLWTSSLGSLQDYDIILRVTLPPDFVRWVDEQKDENPLRISYKTTSADSANNQADISVLDTNGTPVSLSGSSLSSAQNLVNTSWTIEEIEFTGSPTWTAGQDFLITIKVHARNNFQMHIGDLTLEYVELPSE